MVMRQIDFILKRRYKEIENKILKMSKNWTFEGFYQRHPEFRPEVIKDKLAFLQTKRDEEKLSFVQMTRDQYLQYKQREVSIKEKGKATFGESFWNGIQLPARKTPECKNCRIDYEMYRKLPNKKDYSLKQVQGKYYWVNPTTKYPLTCSPSCLWYDYFRAKETLLLH